MYLREVNSTLTNKGIDIAYEGKLPSDDLKHAIAEHFQCRGSIKDLRKRLEDRTI
jgi:Bardet-Biedl syndrome 9 protein